MEEVEDPSSLLKPVLGYILTSRYCRPDSVFLVEGIDLHWHPSSPNDHIARLLLSDGQLCVQALVPPRYHYLVDDGFLKVGRFVRLPRFNLQWREVREASDSPQNQMVFLVTEELVLLEALDKSKLQQNVNTVTKEDDDKMPARLQAHPWLSYDTSVPLRITQLRSIPNLPYKQNWAINTVAVVAYVSGLQPSTLPSYSGMQRTARLADPSTKKRVHLTVFFEPEAFTPQVGSVVLLIGVKNHRFDGGSLKKYASDAPPPGKTWWLENPIEFAWCNVPGLTRWWRAIPEDEKMVQEMKTSLPTGEAI